MSRTCSYGRECRIPVGGKVSYVAHDGVRACSGVATGGAGAGKTVLLETVGEGLRAEGWWLLYGDGDEYASSPLLSRVAHQSGSGRGAVLTQLAALEAAVATRAAAQPPAGCSAPTGPGIYWIIDGLERLTCDSGMVQRSFAARLAELIRVGRRYGIGVLAAAPSLLAMDFAGDIVLRSLLAETNVFAFRSSEVAVVGGVTIRPSSVRRGGGYAVSIVEERKAKLRVSWPVDVPSVLPEVELEPDTAYALEALVAP